MTEEEFWSARPVLQHIRKLAQARRAGPWAVLAVSLARAVTTVPPTVALPGVIGGRQSLNCFAALVGPSGGGKGAAEAAAAEGFRFTSGRINPIPVGSGEGIARTFRPVGTKPDDPNPVTTALFSAPEVDSLAALAARTGSTLSAELRKLYSGEHIGFANAAAATRNIVAAHSYRAVFVVGVQPLRAHTLLDGADGGLPQRFIWVPVSDPDAPQDAPDDPGVWKVKVPAWSRPGAGHLKVIDDAPLDLEVPQEAIDEIRSHRLAVLREAADVDALDGHRLLTQLKAAVGLMALDGRTVVSSEDWQLAAILMDVSARTRERCRKAIREHSRTANTARALATADRDEIMSDRKLQRAKQAIMRWLSKSGRLAASDLRCKLKADLRADFWPAAAELADEGRIEAIQVKNGVHYQLSDPGTGVPLVHPTYEQLNEGVPDVQVYSDPENESRETPSWPAQPTTLPTRTATAFLTDYLAANAGPDGWVSVSQVYAASLAAGYSRDAIKAARLKSTSPRFESTNTGPKSLWRIAADGDATTADRTDSKEQEGSCA